MMGLPHLLLIWIRSYLVVWIYRLSARSLINAPWSNFQKLRFSSTHKYHANAQFSTIPWRVFSFGGRNWMTKQKRNGCREIAVCKKCNLVSYYRVFVSLVLTFDWPMIPAWFSWFEADKSFIDSAWIYDKSQLSVIKILLKHDFQSEGEDILLNGLGTVL